MRRIVMILCALLVTSACANSKPDQTDMKVSAESVGILFSVDGITVYRFGDGGRYHYFAVRDGRADTITLSSWSESCGKNCSRQVDEQIDTLMDAYAAATPNRQWIEAAKVREAHHEQ